MHIDMAHRFVMCDSSFHCRYSLIGIYDTIDMGSCQRLFDLPSFFSCFESGMGQIVFLLLRQGVNGNSQYGKLA